VPEPKRGEKEVTQTLTTHVYCFDIIDLLSDDLFFDVQNLVVNHNKPFGRYIPEDVC
jgi:hypothetical protein